MKERAAPSIIAILISLFSGDVKDEGCSIVGTLSSRDLGNFGEHEPLALAECMESKVGDVLLKSHIKVSAHDCVATVMPAISPDRAKRLGTYWQTQQQLSVFSWDPAVG
ncbi:MAG TPA: hypothetical protein EYG17_12350 [Acidimicrobiia bacterium]|jgi:hypothetical protein|nr:hypothetical protein [Acidimicrobiia bacterium]HIL06826.1 hypothetical protein [Acidimicrobiia bacterium]